MTSVFHELSKKKIIIVAHRGVFGGNVPGNTRISFEAALTQGADMIEVDVSKTRDDVLCLLHPGAEKKHLGYTGRIPEHDWAEVKDLRYLNFDNTPTSFGMMTFDDFLETFKNRCLINVDKFWDNPVEIYRSLERHGMKEQALVKSAVNDKTLSVLKEIAPDIPFMAIAKENHDAHELLKNAGVRYVGVETVFANDNSPLCSPEFIETMHRDGILVWANSILYDYRVPLSGGHCDDVALLGNTDGSWGWLVDRGFDFIQTDWTGMLVDYLENSNKLYRC